MVPENLSLVGVVFLLWISYCLLYRFATRVYSFSGFCCCKLQIRWMRKYLTPILYVEGVFQCVLVDFPFYPVCMYFEFIECVAVYTARYH